MNIDISTLSQLFIITLIIILVYLLNNQKALELFLNKIKNKTNIEHFLPGVFGFQLGIPLNPYKCSPENDCYMGSPMRSQIYQNVCQTRQKISLTDNCQRTLGGKMAAPKNYYVCDVDKHLHRKCNWIKN
jgi:hypothetical protein